MVSAIKDREGSPPPRCAIITPGRIVHSRYREIASSSLIYSPTYFAEARFSDRRPQFKHLKGRTRHPIWQDMFELLSVLHLSDQDCELAVKLFAKSQTVIFSKITEIPTRSIWTQLLCNNFNLIELGRTNLFICPLFAEISPAVPDIGDFWQSWI